MEYQLIVPRIPPERELTAVEQVLANRGISPNDVEHYLNTTDADILPPTLLPTVREGARMFIKHIAQGDKLLL